MIDKKLIEKKLRNIEGYLRELQELHVSNFDEFRKNIVIKRFVERNIELSIEQMIDICKHFVSSLNLREPESYSDCFDTLAENSIISPDESEIFKSMVRFRNILIHGYGGVDDSITYELFQKRLSDFRKYIDTVRLYLQRD